MIDYYKILGVSEDADTKEIKSKYRKLAMKYHLGRNPDDKKNNKKLIDNTGYSCLIIVKQRFTNFWQLMN